jgi:hypothetical protein
MAFGVGENLSGRKYREKTNYFVFSFLFGRIDRSKEYVYEEDAIV